MCMCVRPGTMLSVPRANINVLWSGCQSKQARPRLPWDTRQSGTQGAQQQRFVLILSCALACKHDSCTCLTSSLCLMVSVTHRQTGRAVLRDAVLAVGLPRIPRGRTPAAEALLLILLQGGRQRHTRSKN